MTSTWESRFLNHPLWTVVDQIKDDLDGVPAPADVDDSDALSRIQWLVEILDAHRSNEDPRAYTPTMLDTVQRQIAGNIQPPLAQYIADPPAQSAQLRAAGVNVDTVMDQMGSWPPLSSKGAAIAAGHAAASYEKASQAALATLSATRDDLAEKIGEVTAELATAKAEMNKAKTDFATSSEALLDEKLEESSAAFKDGVATALSQVEASLARASSLADQIAELEKQGRNIVEAVADKAVAHDYRENARNKSVAGWIWDVLGLLVGGTSVTLLLVHLFAADSPNTTTSLALTRLAVSIGGLGLAFLCFERGSSNHQEARRAKRADLRLSTVKPFIANQDPEFQDAIVEGMADRIYLQGVLDDEAPSQEGSLYERALTRIQERKARRDSEPDVDGT